MSSRRRSSMLITRRQLTAVMAAAGSVLAQAPATAPAPSTSVPAPDTPEEKLRHAKEYTKRTSDALSALEVPMNLEPSFVFRP